MFMTPHIMPQARHTERVDGRIPGPLLQITEEELGQTVQWLSTERRMRGVVSGLEDQRESGNTGIKDIDSGTKLPPMQTSALPLIT